MAEDDKKRISQIYIEYEDNRPGEYAIISIPASEVEGLDEKLSWTIVTSPSTSEEKRAE